MATGTVEVIAGTFGNHIIVNLRVVIDRGNAGTNGPLHFPPWPRRIPGAVVIEVDYVHVEPSLGIDVANIAGQRLVAVGNKKAIADQKLALAVGQSVAEFKARRHCPAEACTRHTERATGAIRQVDGVL